MALIEIEHVGKVFDTSTGERFTALEDVNLSVEKGEFVCLLGPSGCGKSTLLSAVAGFDLVTSGSVRIEGREVNAPRTGNRPTGKRTTRGYAPKRARRPRIRAVHLHAVRSEDARKRMPLCALHKLGSEAARTGVAQEMFAILCNFFDLGRPKRNGLCRHALRTIRTPAPDLVKLIALDIRRATARPASPPPRQKSGLDALPKRQSRSHIEKSAHDSRISLR